MTQNINPEALSKHELLLLIPASINIDEITNVISNTPEINLNKLLSLISLITRKTTIYDYKEDHYSTYKKQNIHSNELKKCCGNNYRIYYDLLFDLGIFSKRSPFNKEIKGEHFGYGFKQPHLFSRLKFIKIQSLKPVNYEKKFNNSYVKKYEKILYNLFDKTKFSIDYNLAEEKLFNKYLANTTFPLDSSNVIDWGKYSAYHGALKQLLKFVNGEYSFTRKTESFKGKPSGRFYTPLTLLNKTTRSLLYYEGKRLCQLDVKNMLPYLLSQYLPQIANLDQERVKRLENCPAIKVKYKLNVVYNTEQYYSSTWLREYQEAKYKANFFQNHLEKLKTNKLLEPKHNQYFFLDNPKNLFQYKDTLIHQFNKKFNFSIEQPLPRITSHQRSNKSDKGNWLPKSNQNNKGYNILNEYNKPKSNYSFPNSVIPFTETTNSYPSFQKLPSEKKSFSNYISTKTFETLMNKEIQKFNTLTTKGIIYNHFIILFKSKIPLNKWEMEYQNLFNNNYTGQYKEDRELTKRLFISMLYAQNNRYKREQEIFKSEFPIIHDLIYEKKKGNHTIMTDELFDLEADIIIDTIARELIKQSIPTFTIHDCIVVQEENIEVSETKLKDSFFARFGNYPKIELE